MKIEKYGKRFQIKKPGFLRKGWVQMRHYVDLPREESEEEM